MADPEFEISTDRARIDVGLVHQFLSTSSYWAQGRPPSVIELCIANSLCFGAYRLGEQVGFCRVITDYAVFGYVADMFVLPEWRGRGVASALLRAIVEHPDITRLQGSSFAPVTRGASTKSSGSNPSPGPKRSFRATTLAERRHPGRRWRSRVAHSCHWHLVRRPGPVPKLAQPRWMSPGAASDLLQVTSISWWIDPETAGNAVQVEWSRAGAASSQVEAVVPGS